MKAAVLLGVVALLIGALWWYRVTSSGAPPGVVAIVEVPKDYATCGVGAGGSLHDVPCSDVGGYLRHTLKLGSDVGVLIRPLGNSSTESSHAMTEQVHAAGYLIVPYMGGIGPEVVRGDR
jgi:hypothetical protein